MLDGGLVVAGGSVLAEVVTVGVGPGPGTTSTGAITKFHSAMTITETMASAAAAIEMTRAVLRPGSGLDPGPLGGGPNPWGLLINFWSRLRRTQ